MTLLEAEKLFFYPNDFKQEIVHTPVTVGRICCVKR